MPEPEGPLIMILSDLLILKLILLNIKFLSSYEKDKFLNFIFLSNFFLLIANAEIVKKIDVIGNDRISSKTIILFSNTQIN